MQFEKLEIHPVFLRFPNFYPWQNLSPSALADLIRASLIQHIAAKIASRQKLPGHILRFSAATQA